MLFGIVLPNASSDCFGESQTKIPLLSRRNLSLRRLSHRKSQENQSHVPHDNLQPVHAPHNELSLRRQAAIVKSPPAPCLHWLRNADKEKKLAGAAKASFTKKCVT